MLEFPTFRERPALLDRWDEQRDPWAGMEWMYHDPICEAYWSRLETDFGDFQFLVYDDGADEVIGEGRTVPFPWSGHGDGTSGRHRRGAAYRLRWGRRAQYSLRRLGGGGPRRSHQGVSAEILKSMVNCPQTRVECACRAGPSDEQVALSPDCDGALCELATL